MMYLVFVIQVVFLHGRFFPKDYLVLIEFRVIGFVELKLKFFPKDYFKYFAKLFSSKAFPKFPKKKNHEPTRKQLAIPRPR